MQKIVVSALCIAAVGLVSAKPLDTRQQVPAVYEAGHFYITLPVHGDQALRLLVDTGGGGGSGLFVLQAAAAKRLDLKVSQCGQGDDSMRVVSMPAQLNTVLAPARETPCHAAAILVDGDLGTDHADGIVGAGYMPGQIWTFDYPQHELWREAANWHTKDKSHVIPLELPHDHLGRASGLPRIELRIDGETLPMLLDTGATAEATRVGAKATGDASVHGFGVTSYAPSSLINRWHAHHKDWPVINDGDRLIQHMRLIRVPNVEIAGWAAGPVWFTERPDKNIDALSNYMSGTVKGSAGANIFRHFKMTLDYPAGVAEFSCVRGCREATASKIGETNGDKVP
ncbi:MAG: hypothetical protein V4566_08345 [Pseudomonadota bacterium]